MLRERSFLYCVALLETLERLQPVVLFEAGRQNLAPYGVEPGDIYKFYAAIDYQIESLRGVRLNEAEFCAAIDAESEFVAAPRA